MFRPIILLATTAKSSLTSSSVAPSSYVPLLTQIRCISSRDKTKSQVRGSRGSRHQGWLLKYRAGLGGRHLQGTNEVDIPATKLWNDKIFSLTLPSANTDTSTPPSSKIFIDLIFEGEEVDNKNSNRVVIELAHSAMPLTTTNFIQRFITPFTKGSKEPTADVSRVEKTVGLIFTQSATTKSTLVQSNSLLDTTGTPISLLSPAYKTYNHGENTGLLTTNLPYMLSMVPTSNRGTSPNSFIITTNKAKHLTGKAVTFGRIVEGTEVLKKVEGGFSMRGKLAVGVKVGNAGIL